MPRPASDHRRGSRVPATPSFALALTLAAAIAAACGDGADRGSPAPRGERVEPDTGVVRLGEHLVSRTRVDAAPSRLWTLGSRAPLESAWLLRGLPGDADTAEVAPEWAPDGSLLMRFVPAPETGVGVWRGPTPTALVVSIGVDPGAEVAVTARLRAAEPDDVAFTLLELPDVPPTPSALMRSAAKGFAVEHEPELTEREGGRLLVDTRLRLGEHTKVLVVVVGGMRGGGPVPVRLGALAVTDTGERGDLARGLSSQVVDLESRAGLVMTRGERARFAIPAARLPRRLAIGYVPLARPGEARLRFEWTAGDASRSGEFTLPAPALTDRERWIDVALGVLPPHEGGELELAVEGVDERPVSVVVSEPLLLVDGGAARATRQRPNLLLISIDTLRADALTAAGGPDDVAPRLERLAERGVAFDTCIAPAPYTLPSHVTMLSGQQPEVHGVELTSGRIVPERTPLLAPACVDAGMATAAFTGGGFLDRRYGFDAGFDVYSQRDDVLTRDAAPVAWIERHADQRFFMFLHTFTVHEAALLVESYRDVWDEGCEALHLHDRAGRRARLTGELDETEYAHLRRCYSGALRRTDDALGPVLSRLAELDLLKTTVIVVTSDHGQEIGERGRYAHGHSLHEELVRVPLIVAGPGVGPGGLRVSTQVGVIDVAPTVVDLLGLEPWPWQGRSLVPAFTDADALAPRPLLAEADVVGMAALRWEDGKLIRAGADERYALYDLDADPGERTDLSDDAARLESALRGLELVERTYVEMSRVLDRAFGRGERELDEDEIETLRALGYLGG